MYTLLNIKKDDGSILPISSKDLPSLERDGRYTVSAGEYAKATMQEILGGTQVTCTNDTLFKSKGRKSGDHIVYERVFRVGQVWDVSETTLDTLVTRAIMNVTTLAKLKDGIPFPYDQAQAVKVHEFLLPAERAQSAPKGLEAMIKAGLSDEEILAKLQATLAAKRKALAQA